MTAKSTKAAKRLGLSAMVSTASETWRSNSSVRARYHRAAHARTRPARLLAHREVLSLLLTLVPLPVAYSHFDDLARVLRRVWQRIFGSRPGDDAGAPGSTVTDEEVVPPELALQLAANPMKGRGPTASPPSRG